MVPIVIKSSDTKNRSFYIIKTKNSSSNFKTIFTSKRLDNNGIKKAVIQEASLCYKRIKKSGGGRGGGIWRSRHLTMLKDFSKKKMDFYGMDLVPWLAST
jgi:hypothetical protein